MRLHRSASWLGLAAALLLVAGIAGSTPRPSGEPDVPSNAPCRPRPGATVASAGESAPDPAPVAARPTRLVPLNAL